MNLLSGLLTPVFAQINVNISDPLSNKVTSLPTLFGWITNLILAVGFSLVVVMLALGFVRYIMSQGDKTAVEQAQKWVTYAAMGGVGLFLVYAARTVLLSLVGGAGALNGLGNNVVL